MSALNGILTTFEKIQDPKADPKTGEFNVIEGKLQELNQNSDIEGEVNSILPDLDQNIKNRIIAELEKDVKELQQNPKETRLYGYSVTMKHLALALLTNLQDVGSEDEEQVSNHSFQGLDVSESNRRALPQNLTKFESIGPLIINAAQAQDNTELLKTLLDKRKLECIYIQLNDADEVEQNLKTKETICLRFEKYGIQNTNEKTIYAFQ